MGGGAGTTAAAQRVFLGWDEPPLVCAARWLADEIGADMGGWLVGVPGGRAGRRLLEHLTRALGPHWTPPRIVTGGALVDLLLRLERPLAGRATRTLAWEHALRELPAGELAPCVAQRPADDDWRAWLRLAEEVRSLFGELAAEGLDFTHVAGSAAVGSAGQEERWRALALVQARYAERLAEAGLADPHLERLAALERGAVDATRPVALVGLVEQNALERRTFLALGERATALVFAPEALADHFDPLGALVPERWATREIPLADAHWVPAATPADQARACVEQLAAWSAPADGDGPALTADDVSLGVPDAEVVPELERALAAHGIRPRLAAGTPLDRTPAVRALAAAADLLESRSFEALATLVRHPDVDAHVRSASDAPGGPAALLDEIQEEHLPARMDDEWRSRRRLRDGYRALRRRVEALLGALGDGRVRPLSAWAPPIRDFLVALHGDRPLDEACDADRVQAAALGRVNDRLTELEALPAGLDRQVGAGEALGRLLRSLAADAVPAAPAAPGEPTVELLGWLELALDDAPALVVTGFDEGRVPESLRSEAWLPDRVRTELGVPGEARRVARDAYWTTLLVHSRRHVAFVVGRRAREGDPLAPSRLLFHAPDAEIPARIRRIVETPAAPPREPAEAVPPRARELPRREPVEIPQAWSVTWFRRYLESPYLFYLEHVLGLRTVEPPARELDPGQFGSLAHAVMEALAQPELAGATDAGRIARALEERARAVARERFGTRPRAAVALQVEQLVWRLEHLARHQAARAEDGWRVAHAEWKRAVPLFLDVDGAPIELRGRIDRIDVHEDGRRWALLDYKSGEQAADPARDHLGKNGWKSLQLPLYVRLASELGLPGFPELGYVHLGRDPDHIGVALVADWDETVVEAAEEEARRIVRSVREGKLFDPGRARSRDPILAAILGQGLLAGAGDEPNGDGDGEP